MVTVWLVSGALLFVALAILGVFLRLSQVAPAFASPRVFYAALTLHGIGMSGILLALTVAVYWYLVKRVVPMSTLVLVAAYGNVMAGFALVVLAALGGFGAGWTMLYPLPGTPGPGADWSAPAAAAYMAGFALVVGAFVLWAGDFLRAGVQRYGGLAKMLGIDVLRGSPPDDAVHPGVVAGTVVAMDGLIGILPGTVAIVLMMANLIDPQVRLDALLAKNLLFFSGHILANVPIYLGAGIVYQLLPMYVNRPWRTTRTLVVGWLVTLTLVMLATFHHLYLDFAEPTAAEIIGNVASYASAFPPVVVTIFTGLSLVYRSGVRWAPTPLLLLLALANWAIGGYANLIESSPWVNEYLHNTLWVVGAFHSLQGLGVIFFLLAGAYHIVPQIKGLEVNHAYVTRAVWTMTIAGWGAVVTWLVSGALGQPRRYPITLVPSEWLAGLGVGFSALAVLAAAALALDLVRMLMSREQMPAEVAAP